MHVAPFIPMLDGVPPQHKRRTRNELEITMKERGKRVDDTAATVCNAVAKIRSACAELKAMAAKDKAPKKQIIYVNSAALHRGAQLW